MSDGESDEEYSVTSSQTVYKRTRTPSAVTRELPGKIYVTSNLDEGRHESTAYRPVQKWAVDYNNKNYIRSQCNKNKGLHRKLRGRPQDWQIEYDNKYYTRSKVTEPKGLHRKVPEIKRRYVPENDDLGDATGWEFDYGPEFNQVEQDVHYIPEGKVITRGCYRAYGVNRNDSDCDEPQEEHRENLLNEEFEQELKCGHEFPQSDVPHLRLSKPYERRHSRGAYRHYEVLRNVYDILPDELASAIYDPEWKRKHHTNGFRYLDLDMTKYNLDDLGDHYTPKKGKPFRRTVLNKVYKLRKTEDSRMPARHATRLTMVPGEGERTLYQGVPDRYPFKTKRAPSIRSVFKKKSERELYRSSGRSGVEEFERETDSERYEENLRPEYEQRMRRMADKKRDRRGVFYEDENSKGSRGSREYAYRVEEEEEKPRRHSTPVRPEEVRDNYEPWRDEEEKPRRHSTPVCPQEVRDNYEPWRDSSINRRKEREDYDNQRKKIPKSRSSLEQLESYRNKEYFSDDSDKRNLKRYPSRSLTDLTDDFDARRGTVEKRSKEKYYEPPGGLFPISKSSQSTREKEYAHHPAPSTSSSRRTKLYEKEPAEDKRQVLEKLPPHVEKRMQTLKSRMKQKMVEVDKAHENDKAVDGPHSRSGESIDFMKHREHPNDTGLEHNSRYVKCITKNGSVKWMKKADSFSELHHKDDW